MTGSSLTGIFLIALVVVVVAYDVWVEVHYGADATISRVLRQLNQRWPLFGPLLAFAAGALYGHLFL